MFSGHFYLVIHFQKKFFGFLLRIFFVVMYSDLCLEKVRAGNLEFFSFQFKIKHFC